MLLQCVTGFTSYNRHPCGSLQCLWKKTHPGFQTLKNWWERRNSSLERNTKVLTHWYKDTTEMKMVFYEQNLICVFSRQISSLMPRQFLNLLQLRAKSGHPQQSRAVVLQPRAPPCVCHRYLQQQSLFQTGEFFPSGILSAGCRNRPKVLRGCKWLFSGMIPSRVYFYSEI